MLETMWPLEIGDQRDAESKRYRRGGQLWLSRLLCDHREAQKEPRKTLNNLPLLSHHSPFATKPAED